LASLEVGETETITSSCIGLISTVHEHPSPITHSTMIMQWRYTFSQHTTPLKATTYTAEVSGVAEANTASIIRYEDADHASRHCWENDVQRQPKGTTELKNKIR